MRLNRLVVFLGVFVPVVLGKRVATTTSTTSKTTPAATPAAASYYPPATYNLIHDFQAGTSSFWNNWNFFTGADPTDGFVKYKI